MQTRAHRAELELERGCDLVVREAFEVSEDDDDPALLAELGDRAVQRRLQLGPFHLLAPGSLGSSFSEPTGRVAHAPGRAHTARTSRSPRADSSRGPSCSSDIKGSQGWVSVDLPRPVSATRRQTLRRELRAPYREKVE